MAKVLGATRLNIRPLLTFLVRAETMLSPCKSTLKSCSARPIMWVTCSVVAFVRVRLPQICLKINLKRCCQSKRIVKIRIAAKYIFLLALLIILFYSKTLRQKTGELEPLLPEKQKT